MNRLKEVSASVGLAICGLALLAAVALSVPLWLGYGGTVQAAPSPGLAKDIAGNGGPPPTPTPTPIVSQGRQAHNALSWHTAGYKGAGVKVGIIDFDFKGFSGLQGKELPRLTSTQVRCYTGVNGATSTLSNCEDSCTTNCASFVSHGTSVAEIIHDIAPSAKLYISNVSRHYDDDDMYETVEWMANQGVDVINYSVSHHPEAPGDGSSGKPARENHVLDVIDYAVNTRKIVWVNSAGNDARHTWYGALNAPSARTRHRFSGSDTNNSFSLKAGTTVNISLRWADSWGGADCDLDLYLYSSTGGRPKGISYRFQLGTADHTPYEFISYDVTADGDYYVSIWRQVCSDANVPSWMQLLVWGTDTRGANTVLEYYPTHHHIGVPAESANAGMLAVGAGGHSSASAIKDYSNRGPAVLPLPSSAMPNGRIEPDLVGASHVSTKIDSPDTFTGTSAAAPHVAGLAALVINRYGTSWGIYKPADVANYLKGTTTKQSGLAYPNNTWGHGFAHLPNPAPTAHLSRTLTTIQEQASTSIVVRTNLTKPEGVRVEVNNDKLGVHAGCTAAGNDRADFFSGESVTLKGCSPGRVELRLYQKDTNILLRIYDVTVTPNTSASLTTGTTAATPSSFTINQNTTFSLTTNLPATTRVDIKINNSGDAGRLAFVASGVGGATGSSSVCPGAANSQETHSKGDSIILRGCTEGNATIKLYQSGTTTELASYSVAVGSATTLAALPPPTGLSISAVAGSPRRLQVNYTRPPLTHRYRFELYKLELTSNTWFLESAKGTSRPPINLGAGPGHWHRARGRSCQETNRNICGVWSDWSPRYEFSNPSIAITGLTGSYIAGDTDHFSVTLSDLTLHQPYTVTLESNQGSVIGFNFRCNYLPSPGFTPLGNSHTVRFTLQACQIPGTTVTAQSGTVTARLRKGNARGTVLDTATANATVTKASASLSPVPSAITVGQDLTFTVTTNVPNSAGLWITATLPGDAGRTALPPVRHCFYASSGIAAVNGNTITLRGCHAGRTKLTLYRANSIIQLAAYTVNVAASDTKLSPTPATFTAGHDQTFTLSTDLPSSARIYVAATQVGDPGQITLPPTRGCYHPISGRDAANGNTLTIRGCKVGTATLNIYWANAGVLLKSYTVTVNASNTKLSPTPAAFTAGHDQTFTLTTDIANDPGVYVTATVAGDPGQITLPPTRGCYHPISGLSAVNGNTLTIRGCRAGRATITIYRSNSGVLLKSYTVTVAASNTSLSPTPAAFTIGTNQTFAVTTDIPNTPGVWVGLNYNSADTGRLVLPNQDCSVSSAGTAAVNGNSITLKPCTAGTATIKVGRSNSGVFLVTYTVTINSS